MGVGMFPIVIILAAIRARKRHINFEHITFLKVGTTWDKPPVNQREKFIFPVFRGEHIHFLARLTLGQPAACPRGQLDINQSKKFMFMCLCSPGISYENQDVGKGGLSLRGVAFMTVLAVLKVLAVSVMTATSFKRNPPLLGNGRNTVSRVLFRKIELTEFCGKLGEFCEKLGEFALAHK